jgi:uncharacterized repeat protein (TIGR01451 family)
MKTLLSSIFVVLLILIPEAYLSAQQSANTVSYKLTYDFTEEKYTVWVVPEYTVPNDNNFAPSELGATAQVTLAVPKDFIISDIASVKGSWEKSPLKLGPGQPNQDWSSSSLSSDTNFYVIGKSAEETNYGSFVLNTDVALFRFKGNSCFGSVRIIGANESFISVVDNLFSLNVANSFYSRSGVSSGGSQASFEQFRDVSGIPAVCTVEFIANPDNVTTSPNTPVTINILDNDFKDGTPLVPSGYTVVISTNPSNGVVSVNPNGTGTVNYIPNTDFSGVDCFVYTVCEVGNPTFCRMADVCVTVPLVEPVRQIFAFDDNNVTAINTPATANVLVNDYFNNGIAPFVVSTTPVTLPSNGIVRLSSTGQYTYTPNNGFTGTDVFRYRVCDSGNPAVCDTAAVSIDVQSVNVINRPPIALGDKVATKSNVLVSYNVLLNDIEPDGQPLTATLLTQPVNGSLVFNPNGIFIYTPNNGFIGKDSFTYKACDNFTPEACDDALVDIEVYDSGILNPPPVANDDIYVRPPNQNVIGNILLNDIDPNGLTLIATTTPLSPPTNGTVTINGNGNFEYIPGTNFNGFDSFIYEVCNSNNAQNSRCSQATVFIVESSNQPAETDISVVKNVNQSTVSLNDEVTFSIIVKNNGFINATNVVVRDDLPTGLQYVSGATIINGKYYWQIALLAPGESRTLNIKTIVTARGISTNTATVESLNQVDTNPTNDVSEVCVSVPIVLCQGQTLELSAPASNSDIIWYRNGQQIGTVGNTIIVAESGSYTTKSPNNSCPTNNCCPIVVITQVCCPSEICIPITIIKVR